LGSCVQLYSSAEMPQHPAFGHIYKGAIRREIIPVRGQSYVLRLPKY
jgi:hypothetical protein